MSVTPHYFAVISVPILALLLFFALAAFGQAPDPAYAELDQAYQALRAKDYDSAIQHFERAIAIIPDRPSVHKDLAYTLIQVGENEAARDHFAAAIRLDPDDETIALEFAFLCYETKRPVDARRVFLRYRATNKTAAQAFENVDRPLREGISRWQAALAIDADNFSAHEELARLAEQRDELALAAEHYQQAWKLKPARRDLLLDLGRVWKQLNRADDAGAALLAASRGAEPRVAEQARELLPDRYPFVYEFERALALDPSNTELRRELAFLQLEMNRRAEAEKELERAIANGKNDLLSAAQLGFLRLGRGDREGAQPLFDRVLAGDDNALAARVRAALAMPETLRIRAELTPAPDSSEAKDLGLKSFEKGFLKDALKYLAAAHENDPVDFDVMLKLGWTNNMLHDDREAVKWFDLARRSPDAKTAGEADKAYRNLKSSQRRIRTTVWMFPTFSSRWHDIFAYAQVKSEVRLGRAFVRPYFSLRFVGDARNEVSPGGGIAPQYLSEKAVTPGIGLAAGPFKGATLWGEAGEQIRYQNPVGGKQQMLPDYRGGISYAKGFGGMLAPGRRGTFFETNEDALYVHRFDRDTLFYSQNRFGYTLREAEGAGAFHLQFLLNANITGDVKRQYWANFAEAGPGIRFRFERMPGVLFTISATHGAYLTNEGNPRRPNFNDLRIGVWYAFTR